MIVIQGVTKTYNKKSRNARTVLDNASLTLPDKGLVFIVGESGIGKTTILNAIGGLMKYEGKILYDHKQEDIERYRRKNISYIFQDFMLFNDLSVRDNIRIALNIQGIYDEQEITRRVDLILKAIHLQINPMRRTAALSLGQRQRVAIARALASDPKIILADEPTGNLDSQTSLTVMDLLKSISKDRLVLVVNHNINLVEIYGYEAYRIEEKKFQPLDLEKLSGADRDFSRNRIYVDEMKEEDFASESLLFKFYTGKDPAHGEIKIINDNGKIMVVGDNITLVSPDQISVQNREDAKMENSQKKDVEPIHLGFVQRDEKRSFRDSPFVLFFRSLFSFRDTIGQKKGRRFLKFSEYVIPIIALVVLNIYAGLFSELRNYSDMVGKSSESRIALVMDADAEHSSNLTYDGRFLQNVINEESGLVLSSGEQLFDRSKSGFGTTISHWSLSATNQIVNQSRLGEDLLFSNPIRFADYQKVSDVPMFSELKKYHLADDEIVLDKHIFRLQGSSQAKPDYHSILTMRCYNGKTFEENLIGSSFYACEYRTGSESELWHPYKIVGIADIGYSAAYVNTDTHHRFQSSYLSGEDWTSLDSPFFSFPLRFPKLNDYRFLSEDALSSGYTIIPTEDRSRQEKVIYPKAKVSFSENASDDFFNLPLTKNLVEQNYQQYVSGPVDSEKIVAFENQDSQIAFFSSYLINQSLYSRQTSDELKMEFLNKEAIIHAKAPSALLKYGTLEDYNAALKESPVLRIVSEAKTGQLSNSYATLQLDGTYESSDLTAPLLVAKEAEPYLLGNHFFNAPIVSKIRFGTSFERRELLSALSNVSFLTTDAKKTKAYFAARMDKLHIKAYTVGEVAGQIDNAEKQTMRRSLWSSLAVIALVLAVIEVLENVSHINKDKIRYGILRCLGKSRGEILLDDMQRVNANTLVYFLIPALCTTIFLMAFQVFFFGFYLIFYLLGVYLIMLLASEIPLLLLLSKDPIEIMKTLQ